MIYKLFSRSADGSSAFERDSARSSKFSHFSCIIDGRRLQHRFARWRTSRPRSNYFLFLMIAFACLNIACESPSLKKANKAAANNTPENKVAAFESDLQTMRTAGFDHIFVFRRKDGGVFDAEDKKYLKENSPAATNRFILSDDDKAVIAGSGFEFPPENLEVLRQRFNVEDYSPPKKTE